jgi:hypothetical protein
LEAFPEQGRRGKEIKKPRCLGNEVFFHLNMN